MVKYIAKASDEELSHCACEGALAGTPGQLDDPWCGCGWMISCATCGKSFVYARVVEVDGTYFDFVAADLRGRKHDTSDERIQDVADWMASVMEDFDVGDVIVYLDGWYFKLDETGLEFEGIFAKHKLDRLPHAQALDEPGYLKKTLGKISYWVDRERPDRDAD